MSKSADAFRTISEVAEWLDTPAHVLRFWESKFPQVKPVKRAGGRRYYRPADMALLGGIKRLLHDEGMTIKGVQKLLREQGLGHVSDLSPPIDGLEVEEVREPAQIVPLRPDQWYEQAKRPKSADTSRAEAEPASGMDTPLAEETSAAPSLNNPQSSTLPDAGGAPDEEAVRHDPVAETALPEAAESRAGADSTDHASGPEAVPVSELDLGSDRPAETAAPEAEASAPVQQPLFPDEPAAVAEPSAEPSDLSQGDAFGPPVTEPAAKEPAAQREAPKALPADPDESALDPGPGVLELLSRRPRPLAAKDAAQAFNLARRLAAIWG